MDGVVRCLRRVELGDQGVAVVLLIHDVLELWRAIRRHPPGVGLGMGRRRPSRSARPRRRLARRALRTGLSAVGQPPLNPYRSARIRARCRAAAWRRSCWRLSTLQTGEQHVARGCRLAAAPVRRRPERRSADTMDVRMSWVVFSGWA